MVLEDYMDVHIYIHMYMYNSNKEEVTNLGGRCGKWRCCEGRRQIINDVNTITMYENMKYFN